MNYTHPLDIPRSTVLSGFHWTRERTPCPEKGIHGDSHPMTWAADDQTYLSAGDPNWALIDGVPKGVTWEEAIPRRDLYPHMGGLDFERLLGFGAEFGIEQVNTMPGLMGPGGNGPKPTGLISVNGSLYLAVQNLLGHKPAARRKDCQHASDATVVRSDDFGKTWTPDIQSDMARLEAEQYDRQAKKWLTPPEERTSFRGWKPMFPGPLFGGPTFVQFGQDNRDAIDGFVYAVSGDQWDNGRDLRVGRVPGDRILDVTAWQWIRTHPGGGVEWVGSLDESSAVLSIEGHLSQPEMIYLPSVKRFVLFTWALHRDFNVQEGSELTILEAPNPWGPFSLVHHEPLWDQKAVCPYCPRIPLKWFDPRTLSGWMLHSGNWHSLEPHYKPHVRPFELVRSLNT